MEKLNSHIVRTGRLWLGILALASATALTAAQAAEMAPRSERVSYADLNIAGSAGQATLAVRIGHAVDRVCGGRPMTRDLQSKAAFRNCSTQAMASAKSRMADAVLAAQQTPGTQIALDVTEPPAELTGSN